MELVCVLGFLIRFDTQRKKESGKKGQNSTNSFIFGSRSPQNRSLICWHLPIITVQYGLSWFNSFWNMQKLLQQHVIIWDHNSAVTGEVGTGTNTTGVQLHFVPMMPAHPAVQEICRTHLYVWSIHQFGIMHWAAWKTPVSTTAITRSFAYHSVNAGTVISG